MGPANIFLQMCEEFFEQIPNESRNEKLIGAMDSVRNFLETEVYRWNKIQDVTIASIVRERVDEVWKRVDASEKKANKMLEEYFDGIHEFAKAFYRQWYVDNAHRKHRDKLSELLYGCPKEEDE